MYKNLAIKIKIKIRGLIILFEWCSDKDRRFMRFVTYSDVYYTTIKSLFNLGNLVRFRILTFIVP